MYLHAESEKTYQPVLFLSTLRQTLNYASVLYMTSSFDDATLILKHKYKYVDFSKRHTT